MPEFVPNRLVKAGEVVFSEGDSANDGIFFICYGQVNVSRSERASSRQLAMLGEGDVFGEMAVINSAPRNATVTALTDCGFYTLNQNNFQHLLKQLDPFMRGSFRTFVLTIRDLMSQQEQLLAKLEEGGAHTVSTKPAATEMGLGEGLDDAQDTAPLTQGGVRSFSY